MEERSGQKVVVMLDRQGERVTAELVPRENPPPDQGAIGVSLAATGLEKIPWWQAPWHGIKRTALVTWIILSEFARIIREAISGAGVADSLSGPIGIAKYTHESVKLGASYVLELGALLSINLAIINILPIPALDGGRILFVLLEKLVGRRRVNKIEQMSHTVGFALLILLMIAITFRDVQRFL